MVSLSAWPHLPGQPLLFLLWPLLCWPSSLARDRKEPLSLRYQASWSLAKLPAYAIEAGRGRGNAREATPTREGINGGGWASRATPALTMTFSGLFPFVLLALGTLAPWAVEGAGNGELESPWCDPGCRVRDGGS